MRERDRILLKKMLIQVFYRYSWTICKNAQKRDVSLGIWRLRIIHTVYLSITDKKARNNVSFVVLPFVKSKSQYPIYFYVSKMLFIQTIVQQSSVSGLWLFCYEDLSQWAIIWQRMPSIDREIPLITFLQFPSITQKNVLMYARKYETSIMLNADDTKFMNHRKPWNVWHIIKHNWFHLLVATEDIKVWDELFDDYESFDSGFAVYQWQF